MGSRQRHIKKQARNTEMMNVRMSSIIREITTILGELRLPNDVNSIVPSVRILADTILETGDQLATTQTTAQTSPDTTSVSLGSVMSTTSTDSGESLVDSIEFDIDDELELHQGSELDDPSLWELDDIEMPATSQSGPQGAPQVQTEATPAQEAAGKALDPKSAMAKLQAKLAHAQEHGIKRGMPGMGGPTGFPAQGAAERTSIEEQRAIMEKVTGRVQEKPPGGVMKP